MVSKQIRIQHYTSIRVQIQAFSSHFTLKFLLFRVFLLKRYTVPTRLVGSNSLIHTVFKIYSLWVNYVK
jgi:hypothetical protein